jgi:hypothetical protein
MLKAGKEARKRIDDVTVSTNRIAQGAVSLKRCNHKLNDFNDNLVKNH